MTDNVVSFTGKSSVLSKAADTMTQWFKDNNTPSILTELFSKISNKATRSVLPDNILENVSYGVSLDPEENRGRLFLQTDFRKNLIPEFGTQKHIKFFEIYWIPADVSDIIGPFPDNLMQNLCDYFDSYPEVNNANNTAFCYALLEAVHLDSRFRYVHLEADQNDDSLDGKFKIGLSEENDTSRLYILVVDFLPILLDNTAISFWEQKLEGK